jgi:hypothetical protein
LIRYLYKSSENHSHAQKFTDLVQKNLRIILNEKVLFDFLKKIPKAEKISSQSRFYLVSKFLAHDPQSPEFHNLLKEILRSESAKEFVRYVTQLDLRLDALEYDPELKKLFNENKNPPAVISDQFQEWLSKRIEDKKFGSAEIEEGLRLYSLDKNKNIPLVLRESEELPDSFLTKAIPLQEWDERVHPISQEHGYRIPNEFISKIKY